MAAKPTPEEALQFMHDALVYQRIDFTGRWHGWRMRGRDLVSPDGDRISPERLTGLLWRVQAEARRDAARAKREAAERARSPVVTVLRVRLTDWQQEHFGAAAG